MLTSARFASVSGSFPDGGVPAVMISTTDPCLAPLTCTMPPNRGSGYAAFLLRTARVSTQTLPYSPGQRAVHVAVVPLTEMGLLLTPQSKFGATPRGLNTREIYKRVPPFMKKARAACAV